MSEPAGGDAEVWSVLRDKPELGYLMQTGMLPQVTATRQEAQMVKTLSDLLLRSPTGRYGPQIRATLDRLRGLPKR